MLQGFCLGIQTADCVPVLVVDVRQHVAAAFHAGWRGTVARMVEHGIAAMRTEYGSKPEDLVAAVGPSIGACCYSVGEEVRHAFETEFAHGGELLGDGEWGDSAGSLGGEPAPASGGWSGVGEDHCAEALLWLRGGWRGPAAVFFAPRG